MCFNKFEAISPLAEKKLPLLFAFDHVTFSSLHIQWRKVFFYIYPFTVHKYMKICVSKFEWVRYVGESEHGELTGNEATRQNVKIAYTMHGKQYEIGMWHTDRYKWRRD